MLAAKSNEMSGLRPKGPLTAKNFTANSQPPENPHLDAFLAAAHRRKYPAKSTLIYAGDKSDSIYLHPHGLRPQSWWKMSPGPRNHRRLPQQR